MNTVIVGGNTGIGAALAAHYQQQGHTVVVASRRTGLDVADEASIAAWAATLPDRLDVVINTVGVLHDEHLRPERRLQELSASTLARSFAVNAFAPALLLKHLSGRLRHGERAIFASLSARVGSISDNHLGGWYSYRAAKAAQNQLLRTAAIELKRQAPALIVALLHPGTVDTGLSKPFQSAAKTLFSPEQAASCLAAVLADLTPEDSGGFWDWRGEVVPW
jgi:NAD(P)-dependent dehydrogenase (short-subunit alcohol dehydrogenase family)